MNDRYLFRGKTAPSANSTHPYEWVTGAYNPFSDTITTEKRAGYPVFNSTVGQCTGLRDRNGTLIFEGDVLCDGTGGKPYTVIWEDGCFVYRDDSIVSHDLAAGADCFEIIGNVHDAGGMDLVEDTT